MRHVAPSSTPYNPPVRPGPRFRAHALTFVIAVAAGGCETNIQSDALRESDIPLPREVRTLAARVAPGATLSSLLHAEEVAEGEIAELITRAAGVFDVRRLRTDRPYRIIRALNGALRGFEYEIDADRVLRLSRTDVHEPFVAEIDDIEKRTKPDVVAGAIDRDAPSLFESMSRAGEQVDLSLALAEVLSSEVDFNTELQPGDSYRLLVNKHFRPADIVEGRSDDTFSGYGVIQAVTFENAGRPIRAVRFTPHDGKPGYFDSNGRSIRRFFLKSPLKFDPVITSRFSLSRMHPVLGLERAHLGVDYRAPIGAPVVAVADGVVVSSGMSGDAGRMVHLRHANGYETEYLHLSALDVKAGARVRQGDIVGRVGASGLATGPHLDYRVRVNGVFVNPTVVHQSMPPGDPVDAVDMPAFERLRDSLFDALGAGGTSANAQSTDSD